MTCVLLMLRVYPLRSVNQAAEARATTAEVSSVLPQFFLRVELYAESPF